MLLSQWLTECYLSNPGSEEIPFYWMPPCRWMKCDCWTKQVPHTDISDWRLQWGGRWWSSHRDGPPEPQRECHVVPQSGPSRSCRTSVPQGRIHSCSSARLCIQHRRPAADTDTQLQQENIGPGTSRWFEQIRSNSMKKISNETEKSTKTQNLN